MLLLAYYQLVKIIDKPCESIGCVSIVIKPDGFFERKVKFDLDLWQSNDDFQRITQAGNRLFGVTQIQIR